MLGTSIIEDALGPATYYEFIREVFSPRGVELIQLQKYVIWGLEHLSFMVERSFFFFLHCFQCRVSFIRSSTVLLPFLDYTIEC